NNIRVLKLTDNQIEHLPAAVGDLVQLRELQLDRNHLRELPDELFTLENLRDNQIEHLPAAVGDLRGVQLRELQLDRNHLRKLPDELFTLENLRILSLNYNHLTDLTNASPSAGSPNFFGFFPGDMNRFFLRGT
ncbi:hypothetical protein T484DRAFT_1847822, partial [Baffinella frigidus]